MESTLHEYEHESDLAEHEPSVVAPGDEHDRGVESLCVGEAA